MEKSTGGGGGGKYEIVDLVEMSVPTEEMCEVFSAAVDVKVFMLEAAPSDGDIRVGTSLVRGQFQLETCAPTRRGEV